jgi:hypothetical protein
MFRRMPYIQLWKGSYRFRRRVPDHLKPIAADRSRHLSTDVITAPLKQPKSLRRGLPRQAGEPFKLSLGHAWNMARPTPI